MLDRSKLNEWLMPLTNIAVVTGIVFLAMEIRQNYELLHSESRQALLNNDQASIFVALDYGDIFLKIGQLEPLSESDQFRLGLIYLMDIRNREFEYFQYKNGVLDEVAWLSYRQIIFVNHATPRGRQWWEKIGRDITHPEFAAMVDEMLKGAPANEIYGLSTNWDEGIE